MTIDKQRIAAIECLTQLGFTWDGKAWHSPAAHATGLIRAGDKMHGVLMDRAEELAGHTDGDSPDELVAIGEALETWETLRWPLGKIPGGKG